MKRKNIKTVDRNFDEEGGKPKNETGRRLKKLNAQGKSSVQSKRSVDKPSMISKSNASRDATPVSAKHNNIIEEQAENDGLNTQILSDDELMASLQKKVEQKKMTSVPPKKSPQKIKNVLNEEKAKAASIHKKGTNKKGQGSQHKGLDEELPEAKPFMIPKNNPPDQPLRNITIVITGILTVSQNREDVQNALTNLGARITSAVSGKTSLLLHGELLEDGRKYTEGSKYIAARQKGVPSLSETEFIELMKAKLNIDPFQALRPNFDVVSLEGMETAKITNNHSLWVDLFAPKDLSQIMGNTAALRKLKEWIENWSIDPKANSKKGSFSKAALLSGPPGIGKTTAAKLCAQACGREYIIQNASDARNKGAVINFLGVLTSNYVIDNLRDQEAKKSVIIMDEVDGMSGDRGGIAALIQQIQTTQTPIICICNDRASPKIRSLANHCLDIKFSPPSKDEIKAKLAHIIKKIQLNGPEPSDEDLDSIASSANGDIRHAISNLQFWCINSHAVKIDSKAQNENIKLNKDANLSLNINSACSLLFKTDPHQLQSLKSYFFFDYNMMPFYVFENYINLANKHKNIPELVTRDLQKLDRALDSLMKGDYIGHKIRENRDYQLLSVMGFYSAVRPAVECRPNQGFVMFPQMLGKTSAYNKKRRLLKELRSHYANKIPFLSDEGVLNSSKLLLQIITSLMNENRFSDLYELYRDFDLSPKVVAENIRELVYVAAEDQLLDKVSAKSKSSFTKFFTSKAGDDGVIRGGSKSTKVGSKKANRPAVQSQKESDQESELIGSEDEGAEEYFDGELDFIDD